MPTLLQPDTMRSAPSGHTPTQDRAPEVLALGSPPETSSILICPRLRKLGYFLTTT